MELKLMTYLFNERIFKCLNRTFYGIETKGRKREKTPSRRLNRTFYGIETCLVILIKLDLICLNRTFYGIETAKVGTTSGDKRVS